MSVRRVYETTVIVNAALEDADIEVLINKITNYIENHGASVLEINRWGRRRLAYPINKKYNGYYIHLVFDAMSNTIPIFERFLVLEDTILRHLTLILPEKLREFRAKKAIELGRGTFDNPDLAKTAKVNNSKNLESVEENETEDKDSIETEVTEKAEIV